ncbi:membrane-bound PQQ-dependent dehydrogenase, glucose/quinate/shikimate family [Phenylobacterium sp.]|uniref:membrane-bound PQQ-dependent dehydrogenase, glucose/quinate/shikimate family n=1 Tax=Phenylobacterium sp. TaxID=1871053 RepID=UPI002811CE78|nr:membrane-bound PQQ-dependent dehydrogenase, glucose/quinate/shikimate family [Phenylobacterium sp.]
MSEKGRGRAGLIGAILGGGFVGLVGLAILAGGVQLAMLGGSPYYLAAGVAIVATAGLLVLRRPLAGLVYAALLVATLVWAFWESGFQFWPLLPRLFAPAVLGLIVALTLLATPKGRPRGRALLAVLLASGVTLAVLGAAIPGTFSQGQAKTAKAPLFQPLPAAGGSDWRYYGRDPGGQRYAPFDQINAGNVKALKVAWTVRTGAKPMRGSEDQNTPLQVGDTVYLCTPTNVVIAVDADTGRERWRADPKVKPHFWNRCRGVGYYETAAARTLPPGQPAALCDRRIISSTIDARLIAYDAATGARCPAFGEGGVVDLKTGMGEVRGNFYFQTSTPTVAGDRIIIGGWVTDNQELQEPAGVVRAFDAVTGELVWAWDLGNPAITKLPPDGQTYTRGTPNVWSTPAFDEALGLVYLPTGNATPDYWGSHRSSASDRYNSSVVALDIATGRERWRFQTVHHDVWDYDVPSQPMLADVPVAGGGTKPALIQLTKRGQVFVLDRATGQPIHRVVEKPTPQNPAPGEWVSPTQPYSVDMPTVGLTRLSEKMMWGSTPIDQMLCRISFKKARYDGDFTPPGVDRPSIQYPGNGGGQNWGSGAFDARRGLLIVPEMRMPQTVQLVRTNDPKVATGRMKDRPAQSLGAIPYDAENGWMLGPLFTPCLQPPSGTLTAIDVTTRKIVWQVPAGTAETSGPLGIASGLKIPVGTFGLGGPVTTAGGLTFHASTTDPYLRAYDNGTGKLLWQAKLPVGVGGTPMTYVSPKTGKQYVVVSAGGARLTKQKGDYVIAYALP